MVSILLATGYEKLDKTLIKYFEKEEEVVFCEQIVLFREGLGDSIVRNQPDIVLLSDKLEGNTLSLEQMIRITRKRHPDTRIIFVLTDNDKIKLKKLLFQVSVFDVFSLEPKLNIKEMYKSFFEPKEWKDVADQMTDLEEENFTLDEDFILNAEDGLILEEDYSSFEIKMKKNVSKLNEKSVAFWSIRQQSGTTFMAINTALMLAQQLEQKILLVDLNPNNPNVHIQFNLNDEDGNRNLAALCEDVENKTLESLEDMEEYIITHPFYSNLHIITGLTLKSEKVDQETLTTVFRLILNFAKKEHYTSILFDIESGLEEEYIRNVLKEVDVIITPIVESPGSIISTQKIFDREFGPFFLNFLDLKKVNLVINKASNTQNTEKIQQILQALLNKKIEVTIPESDLINSSIHKASPLLKNEISPELINKFSIIGNFIHNIFNAQPENERIENKKEDKKRFRFF